MTSLSRQTMLQQLFIEERVRSGGSSGIKQVRSAEGGTRPYHFASTSSRDSPVFHEHPDRENTVGLGELVVVMNGVEFRTRHNDYKLKMPSKTSKQYGAVEDIPLPDVPASVLQQHTVDEQISEMQEYFKAFHQQNVTHRDYKPYFKPVMCYLEGGWTTEAALKDLYESDTHHIDATSWDDLQEKIRFSSAAGTGSPHSDYAFLPRTITNVTEDGEPEFGNWNYRIACHPVETALELKDFKPVDDLAVRMANNLTMTQYANHQEARFYLTPDISFAYQEKTQTGSFAEKRYLHGKLDEIMFEIPGKDNYPGYLEDNNFERLKHRVETKNKTVLNVARYHRHYRSFQSDASGLLIRNRGFSDPAMYVAATSNPEIAKSAAKDCHNERGKGLVCKYYEARYTYAVPLEIIWLTPLHKWNPYNIHSSSGVNVPSLHQRNGGLDAAHAYNGTSSGYFFRTPVDFYSKFDGQHLVEEVGVLDAHGNVSSRFICLLSFQYSFTVVHTNSCSPSLHLKTIHHIINKA